MASSTAAPPAPANFVAPPERDRPIWRLIALVFDVTLHLRPDLGQAQARLEQLDPDR
jgi:hypothetical protein